MAFLCPVRIRRGKKKKSNSGDSDKELSRPGSGLSPGMGRITGSASIETLVRVGIEKEHGLSPDSKMVVLHDFAPCVDDELEVKRGQIVNVLYRENDWVYVIVAESRREGFIPHSYCAPCEHHDLKKKLPRSRSPTDLAHRDVSQLSLSDGATNDGHSELGSEGEACPFSKDPSGRYVVLYTFTARDENDVDVERGEFVTVLNREDPDWYWIVRSDGQEGFIPSGFVYPAVSQATQQENNQPVHSPTTNTNTMMSNNLLSNTSLNNTTQDTEGRYHGTELVMLYDYKAQAPDDLSVKRGEWVYADLTQQTVEGWLWAHAPKSRRSGFIPTAYARAPHTTSL
ncbi:PREDICTED: SH3 and PX domain-containing protein 2B isoform X1 [Papilio xuthus]|uniref:SH3 and PX domain-containing protein 2B n=2 Tax=Papilio xuthus TaxID=66420 RepID=A0A194PZX7_PAPXU|nr:PREDICTED: SH3 and PX domain-containing protein 2B isoform X1 [Papilio xuthus]KPI98882.1 SH3 and PX domain-containing protein 2B [Papilio xuthus]